MSASPRQWPNAAASSCWIDPRTGCAGVTSWSCMTLGESWGWVGLSDASFRRSCEPRGRCQKRAVGTADHARPPRMPGSGATELRRLHDQRDRRPWPATASPADQISSKDCWS